MKEYNLLIKIILIWVLLFIFSSSHSQNIAALDSLSTKVKDILKKNERYLLMGIPMYSIHQKQS